MRSLFLLSLLLSLPVTAQVVIEQSVIEVDTTTSSSADLVETNYVMPVDTDAALVFVGLNANTTNHAVAWNTSETLTLVGSTTPNAALDNAFVAAFCLLQPTVTTADMVFSFDGNSLADWMVIHALSCVDQTSCAASMTELDEDVDDAPASSTAVFAELGAGGNRGFITTNMVSADATASNDAAWAEIFETNTGGGANGSAEDFSINVISGDLPEAVTITISETDEHAALYMSVAACGAAPSAAVVRRRRM
jgi:hypothetical protein